MINPSYLLKALSHFLWDDCRETACNPTTSSIIVCIYSQHYLKHTHMLEAEAVKIQMGFAQSIHAVYTAARTCRETEHSVRSYELVFTKIMHAAGTAQQV